jgi:hypothetical protein
MVLAFFTDESFYLLNNIATQAEGFMCKKETTTVR